VFLKQTTASSIYKHILSNLKKCIHITDIKQSTPVGSLQTGHEVIISPNKDRHNVTAKVKYTINNVVLSQSEKETNIYSITDKI